MDLTENVRQSTTGPHESFRTDRRSHRHTPTSALGSQSPKKLPVSKVVWGPGSISKHGQMGHGGCAERIQGTWAGVFARRVARKQGKQVLVA